MTGTSGCSSASSGNVVINPQPVTPTAPIIGAIIHPTIANITGSVELSGLPSTGTWTLTRAPGAIVTSGTGALTTIAGLATGTYTYTVTNLSGCTSVVSANVVINSQPTSGVDNGSHQVISLLDQNYPNPFDESTTIDFKLVKPGKVNLTVYNTLGQVVDVIVDEYLTAGNHSEPWTPKGIAAGIYFYQLKVDGIKETKRLIKK